jgi:plastocyanin
LTARLAALVLVGLLAAGCAAQTQESPGDAVRIPVTIQGGEVDPSGERVSANVGQPIQLVVTSDTSDEIHVHSDPEHEFAVQPGKDQVFEFRIERPGVYDVESHELEVTIVQLEVR